MGGADRPTGMIESALFLLLAASLQPKQEVLVSGHAGWSGLVERGQWAPLVVDLEHRGDEDADLELFVVWASPSEFQNEKPLLATLNGKAGPVHRLAVSLGARSRRRLSLTLRVPTAPGLNAWVVAEKAGRPVAVGEILARTAARGRGLVVTVGTRPSDGLATAGFLPAAATPEHLPEDWRAYTAVQAVVWLDARASDLRSQAQVDALAGWVAAGGRLVVSRSGEAGLSGTALAELLPVSLRGSREDDLSPLGGIGPAPPAGRALILESALVRGTSLLQHGTRPLVASCPRGAGHVYFVAFDVTQAPFDGWSGAAGFWRWLLKPAPVPAPPTDAVQAPVEIGAAGLAGLAAQFPGMPPPELGGLFLLIFAYLAVVGPVDYFLLRRLRRLELTWLTFPAYVAIFTLLILLAGGAFLERPTVQREIAVEDRMPDVGLARRRAVAAVLTPRAMLFDLQGEPVSANFLTRSLYGEVASDLGHPRLDRDGAAMALRRWTIERGATAVAVDDRLEPMTSNVTFEPGSDGTVAVTSGLDGEIRGALWVTAAGAASLPPIPRGRSTLTPGRPRPLSTLRSPAPLASGPPPPEDPLDDQIRTQLMHLSFAPEGPRTGFAEGLDAGGWLRSGGAVLVWWEPVDEPTVAFAPRPGRRSGVRMVRVFGRAG